MADSLDPIDAGRREAARAALQAAFGSWSPARLTLLQGGVSGARLWRVDLADRACVLRLEPERIALEHRRRGFACMAAAAAVGVAPAVRFADAETGVAVIDLVDARPLAEHPGGAEGLARELGGLVGRLQQAAPFPPLGDGGDMIASLLANLAGSGLFAPGLLDRHAEGLARLRQVRPWDPASFVPSHNDPNPRNLLFDGDRLWLVDWELASSHDPLFDLAILTIETAAMPALGTLLLEAAFGRPPGSALRAQLSVTRLLARLFYGCIALEPFSAEPRAAPLASLDALTPAAFAEAAAAGRFAGGADIARAFGLMSLAAFADGLGAPDLGQTLELAAGA